jgi:hypothetical protein
MMAAPAASEGSAPAAAITAVLATHFAADQSARVRQYAKHLAAEEQRIGMIEADASEFRVSIFDGTAGAIAADALQASPHFDSRAMSQVLAELDCDVEHWLIVLPATLHESRAILRKINRWVLLCDANHDGVVSAYRMLKGLADVHRPALSLAVLDAADDSQAAAVVEKLGGVCRQFLNWQIDPEPRVHSAENVVENTALHCSATHDKAQLATAPQWQVLFDFLATPRAEHAGTERSAVADNHPEEILSEPVMHHAQSTDLDEVIDIPAGAPEADILAAIIRHGGNELIECPVAPPMCAAAKLAVSRTRRLTMLAIARDGLIDLRAIGEAYRWLTQNRSLVCMALPQLSIDAHPLPELFLFVNQSDATAEALQPLMHSPHISVRAYRKLRWGEKTGVLLEAA